MRKQARSLGAICAKATHQEEAGDDEGESFDKLGAGRDAGERRRDNVGHEDARKPAVEEPNRGSEQAREQMEHPVGYKKQRCEQDQANNLGVAVAVREIFVYVYRESPCFACVSGGLFDTEGGSAMPCDLRTSPTALSNISSASNPPILWSCNAAVRSMSSPGAFCEPAEESSEHRSREGVRVGTGANPERKHLRRRSPKCTPCAVAVDARGEHTVRCFGRPGTT